MTGRPVERDDPLATQGDGSDPLDHALMLTHLGSHAPDLLPYYERLVAVARAAREVERWHPVKRGWNDSAFHPQHREAVLELREALARLGMSSEEGAR